MELGHGMEYYSKFLKMMMAKPAPSALADDGDALLHLDGPDNQDNDDDEGDDNDGSESDPGYPPHPGHPKPKEKPPGPPPLAWAFLMWPFVA